jgi:hypothetical protein
MPSAQDPFMMIRAGPNVLQLLRFQFASVSQNPGEFNSTAEVNAEASPLLAMQRVENVTPTLVKEPPGAFAIDPGVQCPHEEFDGN